eukprot:TRINITY_DN19352_c0_g1_i3.p1 TRINITY_DN19352_c0_g1~~TRINITY_DN19352_c0_g1_i3.p1  ORF type:complete len:1089 (+),score=269.28 TRINITY_DN19352_c0_g1_i3:86-3352(+)
MDPFGQSSFFSSFHPLVEPVASLSIPRRDIRSAASPPRVRSSYSDAVTPSFPNGTVHALSDSPLLPFAPPIKNTNLNVPPGLPSTPGLPSPSNPNWERHPGTLSLFDQSPDTQPIVRVDSPGPVTSPFEQGVWPDPPEIISGAASLKTLFKLPYSTERCSMTVHRVGQTLVLDQDLVSGIPFPRSQSAPSPSQPSQQQYSGATAESAESLDATRVTSPLVVDEHGNIHLNTQQFPVAPYQHAPAPRTGPLPTDPKEQGSPDEEGDTEDLPSLRIEDVSNDEMLYRRFTEHCKVLSEQDQGESTSEPEEYTLPYLPNVFHRIHQWKFQGMQVLLGSDVLVFKSTEHPRMSLHLKSGDFEDIEPLACLDLWLDNLMADIPEMVLCFHNKGVVQGYLHLDTHELAEKKFVPSAVIDNAAHVLQWLQQSCVKENTGYWLYREEDTEELKLFDIAEMMKQAEQQLQQAEENGVKAETPLAVPLALLCHRMAMRASFPSQRMGSELRQRQRTLFVKCIELLGTPPADGMQIVAAHACDCTASTYLCIHTESNGTKGRCNHCNQPQDELSLESYGGSMDPTVMGGYSLPGSSKTEDAHQCVLYLQTAIKILEELHEHRELLPPVKQRLAVCFYFLAQVYTSRGKYEEALGYLCQSANVVCGVKSELLHCHLYLQLGDICYSMTQSAAERVEPHPTKAESEGDITLPAITDESSNEAAEFHISVGEVRSLISRDPPVDPACVLDVALRYYKTAERCDDLRQQQRALKRCGNAHNVCGQLAVTRGDHKGAARSHFEAALAAFEAAEDTRNIALLCCNLAHLDRAAAFQMHYEQPLELHEQRSLLAQAIGWYEKALRIKGLRIHYGPTYHSVWVELAATYASLARLLFEAREENRQDATQDPELISDLLNKALLLYQQCNQEAEHLTAQQQAMWMDVLVLTAKELLYRIQQELDGNKKLTQRRLDNALGHLNQAMSFCIQWEATGSIQEIQATTRQVLEVGVNFGLSGLPAIQQQHEFLHRCLMASAHKDPAECAELFESLHAELQQNLKFAVKLQEDNPKRQKVWKGLYLRSLKLQMSGDDPHGALEEIFGDILATQ